ncbi:hypothetical protein TWF225_003483 [Orbilia oligospora]|uniref:Uncharacterized protein n=1 Tax=Orbilia oligospora TaxID=2813651 RepID=A0A7C8TST7_ORBOL|nr:hypothetical protein TWF751_000370 [Orbilia oligospora]KAF3188531.1 hypothetical protein TWF225_003483 [Orbilia oligospora]KAF3239446.1 hypothetical protein TWF128_011779 [Orbilia oligospora]KAF3263303.1 hypothetical protein TWF217_003723 [Orbilia oligospora]KAF3283485.1 hypothetical protein TWF132_010293 [Orbilia oligospora]
MAFEVDIDRQASRIRALSDTSSIPPYIPVASPSAKRKRDVLLYITPVSTNSSFNSSLATSFGSDGSCDGGGKAAARPRADSEDMKHGAASAGIMSSPPQSEAPSPRTRVANKLEGLNLSSNDDGNEPSRSAKTIKAWRRPGGFSKLTGLPESKANGSDTNKTDISMTVGEDEDEDPTRTPRKKRVVISDADVDKNLRDVTSMPKKRKSKGKIMFKEPGELEMTTSDESSTKSTLHGDESDIPLVSTGLDEPITFVGSSKQVQPSRRRLKSPPPIIEQNDEAQRPAGELDTDSDPDETGIGYRPTAQQREIRNQKRMQQIKEYKARESREARAKRTAERRRRNVTDRGESATSSASSLLPTAPPETDEMVDVQNSGPGKRVHFAD